MLNAVSDYYGEVARRLVGVYGTTNGCGGCKDYAMNSDEPMQAAVWTSVGPSTGAPAWPWFLRATPHSEPNGDYTAGCWLQNVHKPTALDPIGGIDQHGLRFNDLSCRASREDYVCSSNAWPSTRAVLAARPPPRLPPRMSPPPPPWEHPSPWASRKGSKVFELLPSYESCDGSTVKTVRRPVQDDFTIRFEVRFTRECGASDIDIWSKGCGLVDADMKGGQRFGVGANDFGISQGRGHLMFGIGNPDRTIRTVAKYDDGKWHRVVASRERASGRFSLTVDGVLIRETYGSRNRLSASATLTICGSNMLHNNFFGDLRALRIYDRAFDASEPGL